MHLNSTPDLDHSNLGSLPNSRRRADSPPYQESPSVNENYGCTGETG